MAVQSRHTWPAVPQPVARSPDWQRPEASQQPIVHVLAVQLIASAPGVAASGRLASTFWVTPTSTLASRSRLTGESAAASRIDPTLASAPGPVNPPSTVCVSLGVALPPQPERRRTKARAVTQATRKTACCNGNGRDARSVEIVAVTLYCVAGREKRSAGCTGAATAHP